MLLLQQRGLPGLLPHGGQWEHQCLPLPPEVCGDGDLEDQEEDINQIMSMSLTSITSAS